MVHPEYLTRFSINDLQKNKPFNIDKFYNTGGRKVEKDPTTDILYFALNNGLVTYKNGAINPVLFNGKEILHILLQAIGIMCGQELMHREF